jgi:transcriptional regulator with XRE-family HTH domain
VESVGDRLRCLRHERGLPQVELDRRSGLSSSAIAKIELDALQPTLETVARLARALNVSPVYLATGDEHASCPFYGVRR